MKRDFTRCTANKEQTNEVNKHIMGPCEETLEFIRQFARVYHFEPKLESEICSFIVN